MHEKGTKQYDGMSDVAVGAVVGGGAIVVSCFSFQLNLKLLFSGAIKKWKISCPKVFNYL